MEYPHLTLFDTDKKHKDIIAYMIAIHEFITNKMNGSIVNKCMTKMLVMDQSRLISTPTNQSIFNRKWDETQRNFDEASCRTKYRRELEYTDKVILTLFYVLYNINLYDEYETTELENGILSFSESVSLVHNDMGQLYVSLYKQLQHCSTVKEGKIVISDDKSKEYFIV
jgi:hypothetical protein